MAAEAKVGALFLITVILMAVVVVYLSQFAVGVRVYGIVVHFADVKGLQPGTEVRLAGVKVGRAARVSLEAHRDYSQQPVVVHLAIDERIALYNTDEFLVEQATLIGEPYIRIGRPSDEEIRQAHGPDYVRQVLTPGTHCAGAGVIGFAALADQSQQLMKQASGALAKAEALYADEHIREQLQQILVNLNRATAQANQIADQALGLARALTRTTKASEPQVAQILQEVQHAAVNIRATSRQLELAATMFNQGPVPLQIVAAAGNLHESSKDIRVVAAAAREMLASPVLREQMQAISTDLADTAENLNTLSARAIRLVGDEQSAADLRATLAGLREVTEDLQVVSERTREFFTGEGNLENARGALENVRAASDRSVAVTEKADRALGRVERTMDRLTELARPFQPGQAEGYVAVEATDDRGLRADLNLRLQYGTDPLDFWRVGARDVGDSEGLNLQKSVPLSHRWWGRLGLIQSKIGLGLDYQAGPDFTVETEMYDPDDVQLDLRGTYKLSPDWALTVGVADSLDDRLPFAGMRRTIDIRSDRKDTTE